MSGRFRWGFEPQFRDHPFRSGSHLRIHLQSNLRRAGKAAVSWLKIFRAGEGSNFRPSV
jgi:hypothetical protein